jgi:restriction system protein
MAKPSHRRQGRKARYALLEKGLLAFAIGAGLLAIATILSDGKPMLAAVSTALSMFAWWTLGIGLVLILSHFMIKLVRKPPRQSATQRARPAPAARTIRALIDQAEMDLIRRETHPPDGQPAIASVPLDSNRPRPTAWSGEAFAAIEWRRFEAVCEALFTQVGFDTHAESHGAEGGVDIWLHAKNAQAPATVVRCKQSSSLPVGLREVQALLAAMDSHGLQRGTFASTGTYTAEAEAFAQANGIHVLDGAGLLALIEHRSPAQQAALLVTAFEGEYWKPTCVHCNVKMVARLASQKGEILWGCSNYPRCRSTLRNRGSRPTA